MEDKTRLTIYTILVLSIPPVSAHLHSQKDVKHQAAAAAANPGHH